jgi:hypothetical protein
MSTTPTIAPVARMISWQTTTLSNGATIQAGTLIADSVIEERSDDESVITENSVENGSVINDHAYDLPQELELTYAWQPASKSPSSAPRQPSFLNSMYQQALTLKQGKVLLSVVTGKRQYQNMLIKGLAQTTDRDTENILLLRITLRQIIMAVTQTVTFASAADQLSPQTTSPTTNIGTLQLQPAPNFIPPGS